MTEEKKTIYLVDTDKANLKLGKNTLDEHYRVLTMNSGDSLIKYINKGIPDLILLDAEMPKMSGYETVKIIKSQEATKNIPIVFLTAKIGGDSEKEGFLLGAIDYIIKPFSPSLLLKRVEMYFRLANQNEHLQKVVAAETKSMLELQDALLKAIAGLVETSDSLTGKHVEKTQSYLGLLISAISKRGLYAEEMRDWNIGLVLLSSQLYDVGKIAVKDEILNKHGKLTAEEFAEVKKHTTSGEGIIEKMDQKSTEHEFLKHAKIFAATHHEKWDGTGYPKGLKGLEIPLQGRLMAIADVYDALVSDRPYKEAFSHEEAVKIISDSKGTAFDPDLVDIFLEISGEFEKVSVV
ncbi:MAG: response regulator [Fibromonadales bacterium]|nr:response regulator [Fibromonadales bacterium]